MGTADPERPLHLVPLEPEPEPAARAKEPPRIGLTILDQLAATAFVQDDVAELLETIKDSATALAGDDRQAAGVRMIARELALSKANLDILVAMVGQRIQLGDYAGAAQLDKLATSAMKRWAIAAAEHRLSCVHERRPIVAIGSATGVFIDGGG